MHATSPAWRRFLKRIFDLLISIPFGILRSKTCVQAFPKKEGESSLCRLRLQLEPSTLRTASS